MNKSDYQYFKLEPDPTSEVLYDRLGQLSGATTKEIKVAYLRLAKKYHPDVKDTGDADLFSKIQEAYDCLSDPDERAYYDRNGKFAKSRIAQGEIDKFIVMNFSNVISNVSELRRHPSPFTTIKDNMMRNLDLERDKIGRSQTEQNKLKRMKARVVYFGEGDNPIDKYYDDLIATEKDNEVNAGIAIDLLEASIKSLTRFGWKELDPGSSEGSLRLPGSGRPQFVGDMRNNRQPTQEELQDLHRRGGRGY